MSISLCLRIADKKHNIKFEEENLLKLNTSSKKSSLHLKIGPTRFELDLFRVGLQYSLRWIRFVSVTKTLTEYAHLSHNNDEALLTINTDKIEIAIPLTKEAAIDLLNTIKNYKEYGYDLQN